MKVKTRKIENQKDRYFVRNATMEDLDALLELEEIAWPEGSRASRDTYIARLETFPEGIFIGERNGVVEGVAVTQLVRSEMLEKDFTWATITDNGTIRNTHDPNGDVVYGVNLSVRPSGIGNKVIAFIMEAIAEMAVERNLKFGALGGRLPGLSKHVKKLKIDFEKLSDQEKLQVVNSYVYGKTDKGRPLDPEIAIYKRSGLSPIKVLKDYFPDPQSLNYGVLLIWRNPFYNRYLIYKLIKPLLFLAKGFYKLAA